VSAHDWQAAPIGSVKGVGQEMERKLERLGITTKGELARHVPRRYDDYSKIMPIRAMQPGLVSFRGVVERVASRYARSRKLHLTEAIISDGTGTVKAVWFNQPYLAKMIPTGTQVMVSGQLKFKNNDLALQSPAIETMDEGIDPKETARIVAIYPETEGLSSRQIRTLVRGILPLIESLPETLPEEIVVEAKLMPLAKALAEVHAPSTQRLLDKARYRLAFEELWYLIVASLAIKHEIQTEEAPIIEFRVEAAQTFTAALDFIMTDVQRQAAWEILQDLRRPRPMNRLLEGDVGSGKTVVATMAAVMALANGYQAALMVPTEILARQHLAKLTPLLERLGYPLQLVVGKQTVAERNIALEAAAAVRPTLFIGTQALLSEKIDFRNLGLVIVDEQHRFGVSQRQALKAKSGRLPHLLSMTATPIPRSLQLTVYGDLDITIMTGLPPGRQPITTMVVGARERDKTYTFINDQIDAGRQIFVVCPLIEPSDQSGSKSVVAESQRLAKGPLKGRRIGLLHGRLTAVEKQAVMQAFAAGEIDALVATTVIEVGIDVPNAAVMLIEGAQQFGLAALHQLRGRIGRGEHASYCFLVPETKGTDTMQRLGAMEKSQDGFRLAQIDLELRGPGQIYGTRQHGILELQFADISDAKLLAAVRKAAVEFIDDQTALKRNPKVAERINALKAVTSLD
jgi:ATP-dependent DNA helicase RecG